MAHLPTRHTRGTIPGATPRGSTVVPSYQGEHALDMLNDTPSVITPMIRPTSE
jgi:hypothetical protein